MYLYDFPVQYNHIEQELVHKASIANAEYCIEDVRAICLRLYQEEIMHVLGIDTFEEQTELMFDRMKLAFEQLITVPALKLLVDEWSHTWEADLIMLSFFSQAMFHITHHALQQLHTSGTVCDELISQIKGAMD